MEWISCKDRLPEDKELVLVYHLNNHDMGPEYVQDDVNRIIQKRLREKNS